MDSILESEVQVNSNKHKIYQQLNQPGNQLGVGMIEVLITLFILSIGLLGVGYLQFVGSFTNAEAMSRSQSVMVAQQLSERLRSNAVSSDVGNGWVVDNAYFDPDLYNFANLSCGTAAQPYACFCMERPAAIPDCSSNVCTAAQMATHDAYEVSCSAVIGNPTVDIQLTCDDNNVADTDACSVGSRHSIMLAWPVEKWQNIDRSLNARCNVSRSAPHDCVVLDITL
ncbi:MAG: type IV pilus assembly protein PilV [Paraglaciecola sp.]|jgi:type IV pilus assembly protein PilV